MTKRLPASAAPEPLAAYARHFDDLFAQRSQRAGFRRSLEGVLLPADRRKTLTGLAKTEPVAGAQHPRAQGLPWFLSASTWEAATLNERRLALLRADPATAPDARGVPIIDEHGDRQWGHQTAHVGRQYLANLGKTDNGVVAVTSLWADERVSWPVGGEPYPPAHHCERGKADPACRTTRAIAGELVAEAVAAGLPGRAVVADSCYGEDAGFRQRLVALEVGDVLALTPSHGWWQQEGAIGARWQAAAVAGWRDAGAPGAWVEVVRTFRDGHAETWWALAVEAGPYGPGRGLRAVVATTDPATLPERSTWYLATNLPAPDADLAGVVRLYGLRMWVEQGDKQTKHALGWAQYQVRADRAIRRHWPLDCCAFAFCWWHESHPAADAAAGRGEHTPPAPAGRLAGGAARRARLAGAVDHAPTLLARLARPPTAARAALPP
ncbi:MAG TPA: IS701 family transposase [Thermomicrobiales bacterium]|nr:IS701 family transposase [Thermomicrobiales bacterium]